VSTHLLHMYKLNHKYNRSLIIPLLLLEDNNFTKTLIFCANFLRKTTKIRIFEQLLNFVILCTTFPTYVKHSIHEYTFNNVIICGKALKVNYFIKTLLFCANLLRKITKINVYDNYHVLLFYVQYFSHV
jgi:hypothetical protein